MWQNCSSWIWTRLENAEVLLWHHKSLSLRKRIHHSKCVSLELKRTNARQKAIPQKCRHLPSALKSWGLANLPSKNIVLLAELYTRHMRINRTSKQPGSVHIRDRDREVERGRRKRHAPQMPKARAWKLK